MKLIKQIVTGMTGISNLREFPIKLFYLNLFQKLDS
jgi:hypothetical protein